MQAGCTCHDVLATVLFSVALPVATLKTGNAALVARGSDLETQAEEWTARPRAEKPAH